MRMKYDIFISYRRDGGAQYARILEIKLQQRGYNVFLDYDELTDGVFSDTIKTAIKESSIFMLVLSKESMYRCVNEDDWVRQEIALAIELKKHIVPINPDKEFDGFPESMPMALKEVVGSYQYSDIGFGEMLDVTVDFLVKNHLIPILGERKAKVHKDEELVTAKDERKSLFSLIRNLFIKEYKNESLLDNYIPDKVDFDIFISYRRIDGRDHARNIQQALKAHGYKRIFFDYDSIQKGEFNKRIVDAIYSCTDFILMLSPKSMRRCTKNGDPVANEIRTAVKYQKNIIPVTIDGKEVKWPRSFPDDLKFIRGLQFHDHKSDSYFEHSIDELCEKLTCEKWDDKM